MRSATKVSPGRSNARAVRLSRWAYAILALAAFIVGACGGELTARGSQVRRIVAERWDTVFRTGSPAEDDGLIADLQYLEIWGDRIAAADEIDHRVLVFDKQGELQWTAGREGHGPEEFGWIYDLEATENGSLWVLDGRNVRLIELSPEGEFLQDHSIQHLPPKINNLVLFPDKLIFTANHADEGVMTVEREPGLTLLSTEPIPWPGDLDWRMHLRVAVARHPTEPDTWAAAFKYGPGFMVFHGDSVAQHVYIDPIHFTLKAPYIPDIVQSDSARYGALAIAAAGDELFMLFGGRPNRYTHPEEPTRLIDVYGFDGAYRRSYKLPFHAELMTTDGETFYFEREEPYPHVLALRPIREDLAAEGRE